MSGKIEAITASAVILCTGGCGRVFPFTTNAAIKTGDGMALAYRAGAPLKDMEFVQYHPTGLPFTGILITEAARAEGGYLINKDGYRYLQDYNLGTPRAEAGAAQHGARSARSPVAGVRQGAGEGPDHRDAVRPGRASRPPPPRREDDQHEASVRARAVPEVPEHRSGHRADPGASRRPLHDGRRPHRHQRRDAAAGLVRGRRGRLRQHQRREPARLELAAGAARLRRPRRAGRCGVRVAQTQTGRGGARPGARTKSSGCENDFLQKTGGRERIATLREEMQKTMEESAGIYRTGESLRQGGRDAARAAGAVRGHRHRRSQPDVQHRADRRAGAVVHARRRRDDRPLARCGARSRAARTSAPTFPARDDEQFLAHSLVHRKADGSCRIEYLPVTITRWPPAERVYGR